MLLGRVFGVLVFGSVLAGATNCAANGAPRTTGFSDDAGVDDAVGSFAQDSGPPPNAPCVNLQCRRVDCGGAVKTTIHGKVVTGAKTDADPVYNAIVYIPNASIEPFADGVVCDRCGPLTSGKPVAAAVTAADGTFTLEDVPVGADIPLVVQLGKWRRQTTITYVESCQTNELTPEHTRFPRNHLEGDIPRIAIATGFIDPLECVLRKMGIDDSEFTPPSGAGRVHMYAGDGAQVAGAPKAEDLWNSLDALKRYDMVLLPCEGSEIKKPAGATQNIIDYTNLGGRMMTSHYGYVWIAAAQQPFPTTADWQTNYGPLDSPLDVNIDLTFPKGAAMVSWLHQLGAANVDGTITLDEPRHDLGPVRNGSQRWIASAQDPNILLHMTFNTPVGMPAAQQCGRVVYSDFHVSPSDVFAADNFPHECKPGPMTSSERVLEFMLFDLDTCIQDDSEYPKPPPTR